MEPTPQLCRISEPQHRTHERTPPGAASKDLSLIKTHQRSSLEASSLRSALVFASCRRTSSSPSSALTWAVTLGCYGYPGFLWLPGVSRGEDGGGAQQFFIQISARHREGRVLGQQHAAYGQQSLESTNNLSGRFKVSRNTEAVGPQTPTDDAFRITSTQSKCSDKHQESDHNRFVRFCSQPFP